MTDIVRVLHVPGPGSGPAQLVEFDQRDEQTIPRLLDGGYLAMLRLDDTFCMFVDDDGDRKELPVNFIMEHLGVVRGPVVFARMDPPELGTP